MFNGMEMMMKSLGLDPQAISDTAAAMAALLKSIEQKQTRIEHKLDALINAPNSGVDREALRLALGEKEPD